MEQQDRKHRTLLRSAEDERAVVQDDFEWPQDPELEQVKTVAAS
jgi:hypothetical protein